MTIKTILKYHVGTAGAVLLTTGLFFAPAFVSIGVALIFLQFFIMPPKGKYLQILKENPVFVLVFLLFALHLIAGLYTSDIDRWLHNLRIKLPLLLVPVGLLSPAFRNVNAFYVILGCFVCTAFIIASLTGINYLANAEEINQQILESKPIPVAGGINHIYFSIFLAFSVPAGFYLFNSFRSQKGLSAIALFITIANFALIHVIAARTGLLALYITLVLALIYFILWRKQYYFSGGITLIILPLMMVLAVSEVDSLNHRYQNTLKDIEIIVHDKNPNYHSLAQRMEAYTTAWNVFERHPILGTGMGDLRNEIQIQYEINETLLLPYNRHNPHNQYLSFLAGLGIPGLLLFLAILIQPILLARHRNNFIFFTLLFTIAASLFVESALERQLGVSFFSFFYFYLIRIGDLSGSNQPERIPE